MVDYQLIDCANNDYVYILTGVTDILLTGDTCFVENPSYSGCSTVVDFSGVGYTYDGSVSTTITLQTNCETCFDSYNICNIGKFCIRTSFDDLILYDDTYQSVGFYNGNYYYSGVSSGVTSVVYYNGNKWCLSDNIGGPCVLFGNEPCYTNCPDLDSNIFFSGVCPTTTTTTTLCTITFDADFYCPPPPEPCAVCCNCPDLDCNWLPYTGTSCVCLKITAATTPSSAVTYNVISKTLSNYSSFGTLIYDTFNIDGTGTTISYLTGTSVWENTGNTSSNTVLDGPLNRSGIWTNLTGATDLPVNTWIGYSFCVDIPAEKRYYIGLAADNRFSLRLNGQVLIESIWANTTSFIYWHIYPVDLPSGTNVLEIFGLNNGSNAGFGCEIYDNTLDELTGATIYSDLNIIYTTSNQIGGIFDLVADSAFTYTLSGYTCPEGYVYQSCSGNCVSYTICEEPIPPTPEPPIPVPDFCSGTSIDFTIEIISGSTPTTTTTTTIFIPTINISGSTNFELVNTNFICPDIVKKLISCKDGAIYYTIDNLLTGTTFIETGQTFSATINGEVDCVTYQTNVMNISPDSNVANITSVFCGCENCPPPPPPTTTTTTTNCCPDT
jgi:hypothetical protein